MMFLSFTLSRDFYWNSNQKEMFDLIVNIMGLFCYCDNCSSDHLCNAFLCASRDGK